MTEEPAESMDKAKAELELLSLEEIISLLGGGESEVLSDPDYYNRLGQNYLAGFRKCLQRGVKNYRIALSINPSFKKPLNNLELLKNLLQQALSE